MPNVSEVFKKRLSDVFVSGRITKSELAKRSGVAWSNLDAYLKGKSVPGLVQAEKIAEACGFTLSEFLKADGQEAIEHPLTECARRVSDAAALVEGGKVVTSPEDPVARVSRILLEFRSLTQTVASPEFEEWLQNELAQASPKRGKTSQD